MSLPKRVVSINSEVYTIDVIESAILECSDKAYFEIMGSNGDVIELSISCKRPLENLDFIEGEFKNMLNECSIRKRIRIETEEIRRLIIAQAYSGVNFLEKKLSNEG